MLPDVKRFLKKHKVKNIDYYFTQLAKSTSEWGNYNFMTRFVSDKYTIPFLKQKNTTCAWFVCGEIYTEQKDYVNAIECYKRHCEMGDIDNDVYLYMARCYRELGNIDEYLKYMDISAHSGEDDENYADIASNVACELGDYYSATVPPDLYKSRYYYDIGDNTDGQEEVERKLLAQFEVKLDSKDYFLAYELMQKYRKPGYEALKLFIEKEYCEATGLIKDLSNIVVSYLMEDLADDSSDD